MSMHLLTQPYDALTAAMCGGRGGTNNNNNTVSPSALRALHDAGLPAGTYPNPFTLTVLVPPRRDGIGGVHTHPDGHL